MKKALVFGATGFVGSYILQDLLENPEYEQVTAVVRKDLEQKHPKLKIVVGDRETLPGLKEELEGDDVFIAIGTTTKKTPDQAEYYAIDHDYPVLAASVAREKGATSVFLVSSVGATVNSGFFYIRTKGEVERDIIALDYEHTHIFRPSMIMGKRPEHRTMEKVLIGIFSAVSPLLVGSLKRYRGMEAKDIARAMVNAAACPAGSVAGKTSGKVTVYEWPQMQALL